MRPDARELEAWIEPVSLGSRRWSVAAHLIPLLGVSFIGPLIIWLVKRDEDPFIEEHSREALNFQLSLLIYAAISWILVLWLIGIALLFVLAVFAFIAPVVAAIQADDGDRYSYPLSIRVIGP